MGLNIFSLVWVWILVNTQHQTQGGQKVFLGMNPLLKSQFV